MNNNKGKKIKEASFPHPPALSLLVHPPPNAYPTYNVPAWLEHLKGMRKLRAKRSGESSPSHTQAPDQPAPGRRVRTQKREGKEKKTRTKLYLMTPHPATKQQVMREGEKPGEGR